MTRGLKRVGIAAGLLALGLGWFSCDGGDRAMAPQDDLKAVVGSIQGNPGISVSQLVKASTGGKVESGKVQVVIPPGALPADKEISVEVLTKASLANKGIVPDDPEAIYVEFGPSGVVFANPVTLQLPWPGNVDDPDDLGVYYLDEARHALSKLQIVKVDVANRLAYVETSHFSSYTIRKDDKYDFSYQILKGNGTLGVQLYLASPFEQVVFGRVDQLVAGFANAGQWIGAQPWDVTTRIRLYLTPSQGILSVFNAVETIEVTIHDNMHSQGVPTEFSIQRKSSPSGKTDAFRINTNFNDKRLLKQIYSGEPVIVYFDKR